MTRIIFFGSDDFALVSLQRLAESGHEIAACVTQPDRPRGRGHKVTASPIKAFAVEKDIPCLQPQDFQSADVLEALESFEADFFVVIAYGRILPKAVLDIPKICAVNVHASLLPLYRGAAPVNWAVINGDAETGVSIIRMNERMDAGDILFQAGTRIGEDEDAQTLRARLADLGAESLVKFFEAGTECLAAARKQDESQVTPAPKLTKDLGLIPWDKSAEDISRLIRGLRPWPSAYTYYQGRQLKIIAGCPVEGQDPQTPPGTVTALTPEGFTVAAGQGQLLVARVHLEAAKPMDAKSFCLGHTIAAGFRFDSAPPGVGPGG